MRYLLDTHTLIWFLEDDSQLSAFAKQEILSLENSIFISTASLWEMSIKTSLGKLNNTKSINQIVAEIEKLNIVLLPINHQQVNEYLNIPLFAEHRDPFDRMLIATAKLLDLSILTVDKKFRLYAELINIVW